MKIERGNVVATALELIEDVGLAGLTMRKLADALKIQAPSLYWHFANKDALIEGMADALMEHVGRQITGREPWDVRLLAVANDVRQALTSRRDASRVFAGTYPLSDNVLRVGSLLIQCLLDAGLDEQEASWGAFSLVYFVIGFAIEEQGLPDRYEPLAHERLDAVHLKYPLAAVAMREITRENATQRFARGLEIQLAGLKLQLQS